MATITATTGQPIIVDDEDFEWLHQWPWRVNKAGYVAVGSKVLMHRILIKCPAELDIDHINGDTLDNRKSNLRPCTRAQNIRNAKVRAEDGKTSRFKGVHWEPRSKSKPWKVQCQGKFVGYYADEIQAAKAYDKKAREIFGEFARVNFPAEASR